MPIRRLSPLLVNQIAAGEVIERPASVVKELLENAIDAGPTRIEVTIEEGGRKLIRVSDDGGGMGPDDLALAFAPHATSKIAELEDLFAVGTLGFRGEALASIGAVSDSRIVSCPADGEAHEVACRAEAIGPVRPAAGAAGTTVEVRNLFFNTPARRRFLKSDATEFAHISEQVLRLALPYHRVHFRLTHNGRKVYDLPAVDEPRDRIRDLLGADEADDLLPVRFADPALTLTGLVAPPHRARGSDKWQYLFLNGRYIRDRTLAHAVREAYRGLLEVDRRPVVFLYYALPAAEVDVNVHPTKVEVRFRNPNAVYRSTLAAVHERLLAADIAPGLRLRDAPAEIGAGDPAVAEQRDRVRGALAEFFRTLDPNRTRVELQPRPRTDPPGGFDHPARGLWPTPAPALFPLQPPTATVAPPAPAIADFSAPLVEPKAIPVESVPPVRPGAPATAVAPEPTEFNPPLIEPNAVPLQPAAVPARTRAVQLHNAFIVAESPDGLIVIDQHALHERLLYEQLKRRLGNGGLTGQRLLLPEPVRLSPRQFAALNDCRGLLSRLGIEVTDFGNGSVAIQSFPVILSRAKPAEYLPELLESLADKDGRADPEAVVHQVLDMTACKAAIKAGDPLTPQEVDALLESRALVEQHHTCAHGRPTTLKLTIRDLERQFHRH
jgi:DNA mismatch repair protein MutL